jgi:hypothetical protein
MKLQETNRHDKTDRKGDSRVRSNRHFLFVLVYLESWYCGIFGLFLVHEMTPDADIIATRYTKSDIKSCAAMSYVEAQVRMDGRCFLAFSLLSLTILICRNTILSGLVGQKH